MNVREKIEKESEKAQIVHESAAAIHAIGMEAGYRLAIEALREERAMLLKQMPPDLSLESYGRSLEGAADYLESLLEVK